MGGSLISQLFLSVFELIYHHIYTIYYNVYTMLDIEFMDATDTVLLGQSLKLYSNSVIFWSQNLLLSISQPQMDLSRYPLDDQELVLRFWSYGYTMAMLPLRLIDPPVNYIQGGSDVYYFEQNPMWKHTVGEYETAVFQSSYSLPGGPPGVF
jgi:hypothetical protein